MFRADDDKQARIVGVAVEEAAIGLTIQPELLAEKKPRAERYR